MTNSRNNKPRRRGMPSDHVGVLLSAVALMAAGWLGLAALVLTTTPRIGAELWLFFLLLHFAITGTVIPIVRYVNVRLTPPDIPVPMGGVIVRQSVWIALFVVICAWLQIQRGLSAPVAFFLILVFVVLEVFLRSREIADEVE